VNDLLERLRSRGWHLTAQRRAVAEALSGENVHLTIEEIHDAARERLPEISRATVYNTVNELAAMGEIAAVGAAGRATRYDANAAYPHHHLVCDRCGALRDVQPQGHERLGLPPSDRHGFELTGVDIVFRGVCPSCRGAV
jgi:Fe2+ or Zn2+ uptake regulation protein